MKSLTTSLHRGALAILVALNLLLASFNAVPAPVLAENSNTLKSAHTLAQAPLGPASDFHFAGVINRIDKNILVISGVKVTLGPNATADAKLTVGMPVVVEGVITAYGQWVVTNLWLAAPDTYRFMFVGVVQNVKPWVVSNVYVDTTNTTQIDHSIKIGVKVRVTGLISSDNVWFASEIVRIESDTPQVAPYDAIGPVDHFQNNK
jgi:hypothetical protein